MLILLVGYIKHFNCKGEDMKNYSGKNYKKLFAFFLVFTLVLTGLNFNVTKVSAQNISEKEAAALSSVRVTQLGAVSSKGGEKKFELVGRNIIRKNIVAKVTLKGSSQDITSVSNTLKITENGQNPNEVVEDCYVTIWFPKNESDEDKVYEVSFSVDSGKTFYDKEASGSEEDNSVLPIEITVLGKGVSANVTTASLNRKESVNIKNLSYKGETSSVFIYTDKDIDVSEIRIQIKKGIGNDESIVENLVEGIRKSAAKNKYIAMVKFPENSEEKEVEYSLRFNATGSDTEFQNEPVLKITVAGNPNLVKITNISKIHKDFDSDGGSATITVTTDKDTTEDKIKTKVSKIYDGKEIDVEGIVGTPKKIEGVNGKFQIPVTFLKNNESKKVEYKIKFNANGSEYSFQDAPIFTATVGADPNASKKEMIIKSVKVSKSELPNEGGTSTVTIIGDNLDSKEIKPEITKTVGNITKPVELRTEVNGNDKELNLTINFPRTESEAAEVYKIKISSEFVTVTVNGRALRENSKPSTSNQSSPGFFIAPIFNEQVDNVADEKTPLGTQDNAKDSVKDTPKNIKSIFSTIKKVYKIDRRTLESLDRSVSRIGFMVKNGGIKVLRSVVENANKDSSFFAISVNTNKKKVRKILNANKYVNYRNIVGEKIYAVKLVVYGKIITKSADKMTVYLNMGKEKVTKLFAYNIKTGQRIKATFDKKTKSAVFKTNELGKFVIVRK